MGTQKRGRPFTAEEPLSRRIATMLKESTFDAIEQYANEHRRSISEVIRFTLEDRFDKKE